MRSLDREETASYNLKVSAVDRASPGKRNATTEVIVNLEDVNDNSPRVRTRGGGEDVEERRPAGETMSLSSARFLSR